MAGQLLARGVPLQIVAQRLVHWERQPSNCFPSYRVTKSTPVTSLTNRQLPRIPCRSIRQRLHLRYRPMLYQSSHCLRNVHLRPFPWKPKAAPRLQVMVCLVDRTSDRSLLVRDRQRYAPSSDILTDLTLASIAQPELIPEWEPDVKVHIPESATLDARIASYSRFAEPPPKLRSKVLAREQGVPIALEVDPSSAAGGREGRQAPRRGMLNAPPTGERERLGRLRKPAVNGLVRIEKGSTPASSKGKGKMRDTALHLVSDLSGIAGEWTLDPALPRLGSIPASASRPSLGAYSTRSALSATGSRNSLLTSEQGHSLRSSGTDSSLDLTGESTASIWKKRKRLPQDIGETRRTLPTAVFETDKGNIDVRLAVVDDASFPVTGVRTGDTTTERYMQGATERKGLLNARVEGDGALTNGLGAPSEDSCARVEVLTRKGNVRVEVVCL